jgi:hypothetical protein
MEQYKICQVLRVQYLKYEENLQSYKKNLLIAINSNVNNPILYERDLKLDIDWNMWTDGKFALNKPVERTVMQLVNSMGGWKN